MTANDTPDGGLNPFPNDIKYRIYDRTGDEAEILLINSFDTIGFSTEGFFENTLPLLADGIHNLKLEVEDRAGNISHEFLLEIEIDTDLPTVGATILAEYSDSGMSDSDRVTNIREPAFVGVGNVGNSVRIFANGVLAGETIITSDETDGVPGNGLGVWEITVEPLDDDVYEIVAEHEDWAGNVVRAEPIEVEIDTIAPNTPFLDLREEDDTGRHDDDNITREETLVFSATTTDLNNELHLELIPGGQNLKYRVYARPEFGSEILVYNSATDPGLGDLLDGLTASERVETPPLALPEGPPTA